MRNQILIKACRFFKVAGEPENGARDSNNPGGSAAGVNLTLSSALCWEESWFHDVSRHFIYGSMVMQCDGRKLSRIVEVMVSSVKPINPMMGKLIGVGGVGLTQLVLWVFDRWSDDCICFFPGAMLRKCRMWERTQVNEESFNNFSFPLGL
jgi:hypothetical protein